MRDKNLVEVDEKREMIVVFMVSYAFFAFWGTHVKEILHGSSIFPIPGAPPTILGIINVRGDIESVIDIHRILGYPSSAAGGKSRIIIAQGDEIRTGVLVDQIDDVLEVPVSAVGAPLSTLDDMLKEFVTGELTLGDRNVTLLNAGKIFRAACS